MAAQILVTKPKVLNAADKKLLREAGVVVVEAADPAGFRLLSVEGQPISTNDMFWAAMQAIASDKFTNNTRAIFVKNMASLCKVSEAMKP